MKVLIGERKIAKEKKEKTVTKLLIGEEVLNFLIDTSNQMTWDKLFQECPWKTVFQCRKFIDIWYNTYKESYLPILVVEESAGELVGLLSMAAALPRSRLINKHSRLKIHGAGHYRAEYQVWLTSEANKATFIQKALKLLGDRFPKSDIFLRYIPEGRLLKWVSEDPYWKKHCVVQSYQRAIIKTSDPAFQKIFTKKEYKNKRNRLKRMKNFEFNRIQNLEEFEAILPELIAQYDFRQGTKFNKTPFRDAPEMKDLLLALFKENFLHVTVMRANNEILASIVAVVDNDWAHLGAINTHTPFHTKNSPGFVHFIMLSERLAEEGYNYFDLTAGGDLYKKRMANLYNEVFTLVYTQNNGLRLKRKIRKFLMNLLIKAKIRPMTAELKLKRNLYLLKNKIKLLIDKDGRQALLHRYFSNSQEMSMFVLNDVMPIAGAVKEVPYNIDKLEDHLAYTGKGSFLSKWEFLENSMLNFEMGKHSFTWVEKGELKACVWVSFNKPGEKDDNADNTGPLITSLYYHPSLNGQVLDFIITVSSKIMGENRDQILFAKLDTDLVPMEKLLLQAGFAPYSKPNKS